MAHHLDTVLLAPMGNTSASTGLVLGLGTAWGLVHHWWVLGKFAITFVQLNAGVLLLSAALDDATGTLDVGPTLVVGTALMIGALGFQAWLSVAKPGPRTRWGRDRRTGRPVRLPTAPAALFALAVLGPLTDVAIGTAVGFPAPLFALLSVVAAIVLRRRALRSPARATRPAPVLDATG